MKTVKELSEFTGVSVRTLHYYDEIGLLTPSARSEAGYRLYSQDDLERLQQILFFREFALPLKEIRDILAAPGFDRNEVLRTQRRMLETKRDRLQRLIAGIDDILKGENKMDFAVFNQTELEELSRVTWANMPEPVRAAVRREFGGEAAWRQHYLARCAREDIQQGYRRMISWYGGKEAMKEAMLHPPGQAVARSYQSRLDAVMEKLAQRRAAGGKPGDFAVREVIGEYGFVVRQLYQVREEGELMLSVVRGWYGDPRVSEKMDRQYGAGMAAFFTAAVEDFYGQSGAEGT